MSKLNVNAIEPSTGTDITLGASGDTITVPSGATFTQSGTMNASAITAGTLAIARGGTGAATLAAAGITATPAFFINKSANQAINDVTNTIVTFDTEIFDTNSAFASNTFTVPAGEAGKYWISYQVVFSDSAAVMSETNTQIHLNDVVQSNTYASDSNGQHRFTSHNPSFLFDLSVADELKVNSYVNTTDGGTADVAGGSNYNTWFQGFKLIG